MFEVEVKVRADHDAVRERLDDLDADRIDSVRQVDTYFDAPHRDFAETDEALRLRRETDLDTGETVADLTYKGPLVEAESKTREELETPIAVPEELEAILGALGFDPAATVEKERERFALDGYTVALDGVAGLGEFVEVEAATDDEDAVETVREGAIELLETLGLDAETQIRTSYLGLFFATE